jgi:hypothetical protein
MRSETSDTTTPKEMAPPGVWTEEEKLMRQTLSRQGRDTPLQGDADWMLKNFPILDPNKILSVTRAQEAIELAKANRVTQGTYNPNAVKQCVNTNSVDF